MVVSSASLRYLNSNPGKYSKSVDKGIGTSKDIMGLASDALNFGSALAQCQGDQPTSDQLMRVATPFSQAGSALGSFRVIFSIEKFATGKVFWKTTTYKGEKGETYIDKETGLTVKTGDVIWEKDKEDNYKTQSWSNIAADVLRLIQRTFSGLFFANKHGIVELGDHAKGLGEVSSGVSTVYTLLDFYKKGSDLYEGKYTKRSPFLIMKMLGATLGCVGLPFTLGIFAMNGGNLAILVAGSSIFLANSLVSVGTDIYFGEDY